MRLICPNCDAEYEIADDAIPEAGRDVQCSSCGHAWFQRPPDFEAEEHEEEEVYAMELPEAADAFADDSDTWETVVTDVIHPEEPELTSDTGSWQTLDTGSDTTDWDDLGAPPPAADADYEEDYGAADETPLTPPRRALDESLLSVLREEAARESEARRAEARPIEIQQDLGLDEAAMGGGLSEAARRRIAQLKGEAVNDPALARGGPRRELLPDIEEINSSLRASSDNRVNELPEPSHEPEVRPEPVGGFALGFMTMIVIALALGVVYAAAPIIVDRLPAAEPAMASYVEAADSARLFLDDLMKRAVATLEGLIDKG